MVGFKRTLTLNVVGRISAIQFAGPSVSKVAFDPNIKINHPKDNQGSPNKKILPFIPTIPFLSIFNSAKQKK